MWLLQVLGPTPGNALTADRALMDSPPTVAVDVATLERDSMGVWRELRQQAPVVHLESLDLVAALRYDDVKRVARDESTFSAAVDAPLSRTIGPNFMYADGAAHRALRAVVAPLLKASTVEAAHRSWVSLAVERLVSALPTDTPVELMTAVAEPLAVGLLRRIVGLQETDESYRRWFKAIAAGAANFERDPAKDTVAADVMDEIRGLVDQQLGAAPANSLLAGFRDLPREQLIGAIGLFLIGGLQEPRDLLGLTIAGLAGEPEQWDELRRDARRQESIAAAVEEAARWGSPVGTVTRISTRDTELSGIRIPTGTVVAGVIGSANRDQLRWHDPDRYVVGRREGPHLAFGSGTHACIGAAAARMLTQQSAATLLVDHELTLVEPPTIVGYEFRGPTEVWATLTR